MADNRSPLEHVLSDGEDFELLFAVSPDDGRKLIAFPDMITPRPMGEIEPQLGCRIRSSDGTLRELPRGGWEHSF